MNSIVPQLIANSIIAGSIYSLVALGFNLIFGTTKFFNLTHGVIATIGGYGTFAFLKIFGFGLPAAIFLGILTAALVGWLTDILIFRRMRRNKSSSTVMLVASLGLFTALQAFIAIIFTSQFKTLSSSIGRTKVHEIFGGILTNVQIIIVLTSFSIMIGLVLMMKFTKLGKAIKAISDDEEVAKIVGINTPRVISWVFIIGSAIAGIAGIAIGFDTGIEPTMGMSLLLKGVIAMIIGGVGNVYGGVLGAYFLGFVENFGIWHISGEWKDAIAFSVLILFLIFRPGGIMRKK
jgi:branched-chain amino acid transport system permease protein